MDRSYKSIQIFKNPIIEKLTHVHPLTPFVVWVPVVFLLFWHFISELHMSFYTISTLGSLGFFTWTLQEYILHRFLFHFEGESVWSQRCHFLIHGIHHSDPNDPTRLVMPPVVSLVLAIIYFLIFRVLLGADWVEPFFAFFLIGYLIYDFTHFSVHHFTPRTRFGKMLKSHHMQHHFVNPNSRWGVSSPLWDFVFGTLTNDVKDKKSTI